MVHCKIGKGLAVKGYTLLFKPSDKLGITHSVKAYAGVDPLDPQRPELSLLVLAVTVGIAQTLLKYVLGNGVNIGSGAEVPFGLL